MSDERIEPYATAIRKLLKGVIYYDDTAAWQQIRDYEYPIREYLGKIGLGMHLDEIGNFAYLYDDSRDDDNQDALTALTSRRNLSFPDTLLLVLLRERWDEHEMRDLDGNDLILNDEDLLDMIQVFMQDYGDARKIESNTTTSVNRLVRYGFLTKRSDGRYTVRPLIRAKINADELEGIKARLVAYVKQDSEMDGDDDE
jgi:hypothetical protein